MKIWEKSGTVLRPEVMAFTRGKDLDFDQRLARYDILGTLAHIAMLQRIGTISEEEHRLLKTELESLLANVTLGDFAISADAEDVHSYIEQVLIERTGDAGRKVHTGRSRNDQVALDIKLYLRDEIRQLKDSVLLLFDQWLALSGRFQQVLMPGYTHMQAGMPSSFGLWFGAYAESLTDDMELLLAAWQVINKNPLGSGAGYGSSFPLDRQMTTDLLGFAQMNYNSIYAQMTRGKGEKIVAIALAGIAATLSRFSMDVCLYMGQDFGFISFPDHLTTGSSIMPHKRNPDVFELIRAKCNRIQSVPNELTLLMSNLPVGYHRDVQLTKQILFPALDDLKECMDISLLMLEEIVVNDNLLSQEKYRHIYTVEKINELVNQGVPFRKAYRQVGEEVMAGRFHYAAPVRHTHEGSIGNLCNTGIRDTMQRLLARATW